MLRPISFFTLAVLLLTLQSCANGSGSSNDGSSNNDTDNREICTGGDDEDGDGLTDCEDPDCTTDPACNTYHEVICSDSLDGDKDGLTDCEDPDCTTDPACTTSQEDCSNNVDDDDDDLIDCLDPDCESDSACQEDNRENCTNGTDDDGDGYIDCADPGCETDPACFDVCDENHIFYDSNPDPVNSCPTGKICTVTGTNLEVDCADDSVTGAGTFYGECGPNGQCPAGSTCYSPNGRATMCYPLCNMTSHPNCPDGGICFLHTNNSLVDLCIPSDDCHPADSIQECPIGEGCYIIQDSTLCLPSNNVQEDESCSSVNDCAPGLLCVYDVSEYRCLRACHPGDNSLCTSGMTCQAIQNSSEYGVCK